MVLYHLLAVLILPNPTSLVTRHLSPLILSYANLFGLNTPWRFFSPGPSPTFYLQYQIETERTLSGEEDPESRFWPPPRQGFSWDDAYNRQLYSMRFFALDPERLENFFVPWLCRKHPEAVALAIEPIFHQAPGIQSGELEGGFAENAEKVRLKKERFDCPSKQPNGETDAQAD